MNGREQDEAFCSNPDCILHLRSGDAGVIGWVGESGSELADGTPVLAFNIASL